MTTHKANIIEAKLSKKFPEVTMEVREAKNGVGSEVYGTAKQLNISAKQLRELADTVDGHTVTFGRTGANFRMIIS